MSHEYQGRPIATEWHSTPPAYIAYFADEYDGAVDSRHSIAFGRTEDEAVAALIEIESDREAERYATAGGA